MACPDQSLPHPRVEAVDSDIHVISLPERPQPGGAGHGSDDGGDSVIVLLKFSGGGGYCDNRSDGGGGYRPGMVWS